MYSSQKRDAHGALWVQWWFSKQTGSMDFYGSAHRTFGGKISPKRFSKQTREALSWGSTPLQACGFQTCNNI